MKVSWQLAVVRVQLLHLRIHCKPNPTPASSEQPKVYPLQSPQAVHLKPGSVISVTPYPSWGWARCLLCYNMLLPHWSLNRSWQDNYRLKPSEITECCDKTTLVQPFVRDGPPARQVLLQKCPVQLESSHMLNAPCLSTLMTDMTHTLWQGRQGRSSLQAKDA